mmetsp:Transcript_15518/g.11300  ORF Transcript_15518/g.11300 Transcript_15518/m.11300 type:complete len:88 (+) Transcript_15518:164-427(+)
MSGSRKMFVHFSTIYFGCVADDSYNEEKAFRLLADLHTEFSKVYKGNLHLIQKQTNLTPNCFDKMFKPNFQKVIENYNTGISSKNLQ